MISAFIQLPDGLLLAGSGGARLGIDVQAPSAEPGRKGVRVDVDTLEEVPLALERALEMFRRGADDRQGATHPTGLVSGAAGRQAWAGQDAATDGGSPVLPAPWCQDP